MLSNKKFLRIFAQTFTGTFIYVKYLCGWVLEFLFRLPRTRNVKSRSEKKCRGSFGKEDVQSSHKNRKRRVATSLLRENVKFPSNRFLWLSSVS